MNVTGLLRILFRWKKMGLGLLVLFLTIGLLVGSQIPLRYEGQISIERKPLEITPGALNKEFDMTRLTSETERSIAIIKSRAMMEKWLEALSIKPTNAKERERKIKRLRSSLSVKPVAFTDLLQIKVLANSPEEAKRKVEVLSNVYADWDMEYGRKQAERMTQMLKSRMEKVKGRLARDRMKLARNKSVQSLRLSGTLEESALASEILAKEKLYDSLTEELEQAERRLTNETLFRITVVAEPTASQIPIRSRKLILSLAVALSMFFALLGVILLESQDSKVHRAGDIFREIPLSRVIVVPRIKGNSPSKEDLKRTFHPFLETVSYIFSSKGSVIVQVASPRDGDGKTAICGVIEEGLKDYGLRSIILPVSSQKSESVHSSSSLSKSQKGRKELFLEGNKTGVPIWKKIQDLKKSYDAAILDLDLEPDSLVGSNLLSQADVTGIVMTAGRTPRKFLCLFENQLKNYPNQRTFYILNRAYDPLPQKLRS